MDDIVYVWPCGSHCDREALQDFLTHMKGDYVAMTEAEFYELYPQEDQADELHHSTSTVTNDSSNALTKSDYYGDSPNYG